MKILLLNTDDFTGGAAIACKRLLKALRLTNVNSTMLVQQSVSREDGVFTLNDNWLGNKMAWLRFVAERLYFYFFEKSKAIRFLFNPGKFGVDISDNQLVSQAEILHLHWINFGYLSIHSLKKIGQTGKPIVWTLHDMWAFTGGCHHSGSCDNFQKSCGSCTAFLKKPAPTDLSNQVWQNKMEAYAEMNLTIVTCSQWLGAKAQSSSLFSKAAIYTIPNPIDVAVYRPSNKIEAKALLNIPQNKKYILFAAMNVKAEGKGYQYFKKAIEKFTKLNRRAILDFELLIMGSGTMDDFQDLPLKVNYLGQLVDSQRIIAAYNAAEVYIIPSLAENLPNTIMESMACGVPCLGFEVGGIPEMIDHQKTGYLAQYKSAEDLANGLNYILYDADYEVLCQNSRKKAIENYAEEIVANQYKKLYQSILK